MCIRDSIRTLHRNLLLPLGVKLEPDCKLEDDVVDEDSDDESGELIDYKNQSHERNSSKSRTRSKVRKGDSAFQEERQVKFESQPDTSSDICLKSDTVIAPDSRLKESEITAPSDKVANNHSAKSHLCLLYTSPSPRDATLSRMPSSA